jgi:hypothetical protein
MKAFQAIWIGDDDPSAQIIMMGDLRFIKGDVQDVPEDHAFGDMIYHNPTFEVLPPVPEPVHDPVDDDRLEVIAALEAAEIKFDRRSKTDTLRALLVG